MSLFVVISLFVANVQTQVNEQTKPLVGADIIIESSQEISSEAIEHVIQVSTANDLVFTEKVSFSTNLSLSGSEAKLVQVQ